MCGAEAATVVNNNAAALVLILEHFCRAEASEVIISRGELLQIGGGFRIPEILEARGARLREVGTTNQTSVSDYARAITRNTALIMKVHRSNFFMDGFVDSPSTEELAALARKKRVPFVEDLGSGAIEQTQTADGAEHEPTPAEVIRRGVDLVCFSGDKLFGGPQAGIIVGRKRMIAALKRAPLFRALRCDKLILSALESTADAYLRGDARIPVLEMMHTKNDDLRASRRSHRRGAGGTAAESPRRQRPRTDWRRHAASIRAAVGDDRGESSHARSTGSGRRAARAAGAGDWLRRPRHGETRSPDDLSAPGRRRDPRTAGRGGRLTFLMSDTTHYIVATAGHVDHGKSALIKALTGTDPDRLPEEKARGITIDLGFAHLDLPSPASPVVYPRRHRRRTRP